MGQDLKLVVEHSFLSNARKANRVYLCIGGISAAGRVRDPPMDDVEELRWEPARKLPNPVAAGEAETDASLVPNAMQSLGKQVLL